MGELIGKLGRGAVAALGAVLVAAMLGTPAATAQAPAICDQYEGLTHCVSDEGESGGGGGGGPGGAIQTGSESGSGVGPPGLAGAASAPGAAGSVVAAGGELPFTGYPLTPLVWLLLTLLVLGLAVRAYLALRDRARSAADGT